jgi:hypothetical protein
MTRSTWQFLGCTPHLPSLVVLTKWIDLGVLFDVTILVTHDDGHVQNIAPPLRIVALASCCTRKRQVAIAREEGPKQGERALTCILNNKASFCVSSAIHKRQQTNTHITLHTNCTDDDDRGKLLTYSNWESGD